MPIHYHGDPDEARALDAYVKLTRAASAVEGRLLARGTYGELTATQFGVLEALYHLGPLCQRELGIKLLKSGGNITFVVDNLVRLGLVIRQRDLADRRRVIVSLTEAGQAWIASRFPQHAANIREAFAVLTPEEQQQLAALCRKLGKAIG